MPHEAPPVDDDDSLEGWEERARVRGRVAARVLGDASSQLWRRQSVMRSLSWLPPESFDFDLGDPAQRRFGDYELIEKLGQGGMGVVYRARQLSLGREVALKILAAGPWASAEYGERFQREASHAASLSHPNIVAIHEISRLDDVDFFSMRLVRGASLAERLAVEGPMAARAAAQLMRTIAEALAYAHSLDVLHLDLKPGNVLIETTGEPLVADFGLARRFGDESGIDTNEISGTPSYMAPEQVEPGRAPLSPATDVFGLGAILYECLTGRAPSQGRSAQATMREVLEREPVPPRAIDPSIPQDLEAVCLKCLAKDPRERYPNARALGDDLGRFIDGRAVSVRPLGRGETIARWARREPRFATALAAATLALVVGFVATLLQWQRADANAISAERSAMEARGSLWSIRARNAEDALARGDAFRALRPLIENLAEKEGEGRHEAAGVERQRIGTLLANAPTPFDVVRLPEGVVGTSAAISPNGSRAAVATHSPGGDRTVRQYDVASGRELWSTSTDGVPQWLPFGAGYPHGELRYTPDGTRIIVSMPQQPPFAAPTRGDSLAFDAESGRMLMPPVVPPDQSDIVFSDDARLAFVRFRSQPALRFPDSGQLFETEGWTPLAPRRAFTGDLAGADFLFSPDARMLLASNDFVGFSLLDAVSFAATWQFALPPGDPARSWRFSPDASLLALGTVDGAVYLLDLGTRTRTTLPAAPASTLRWLEFSEDGRRLVAGAQNGAVAAWDLAARQPLVERVRSEDGAYHMTRLRVVGPRVWSAFSGRIHAWTLPESAAMNNEAQPGAAQIRDRRGFDVYGFDVHRNGLIVTAGSDGSVGFWRMPREVVLDARAAPLTPRRTTFDGRRIVAVDGRVAEIRDVVDGRAIGPRLVHPEPVRLAELDADGRRLVTVAGRTVRVFDAATAAPIGAPIVLPQSPLRADLASRAPVLVLTTGRHESSGFVERIHAVDLEHGRLRDVSPTTPGPLVDLGVDARGRYAIGSRWQSESRKIEQMPVVGLVPAASTCASIATPNGSAWDFVLDDDGRHAWMVLPLPNRRSRLERWDLERCAAVAMHEYPNSRETQKLALHDGGAVAKGIVIGHLSLFDTALARRDIPGIEQYTVAAFAVSADGRLAALAQRASIVLLDLRSGERVSASINAGLVGQDGIGKLAFSPDARRLLARTIKGRWLLFEVASTEESLATLVQLADRVDAGPGATLPEAAELEALRARLRAREAIASPTPPGPRAADVVLDASPGDVGDPRFVPVEFGAAINAPLNGAWPRSIMTGGDQPTLATGLQRWNDVDWRIDGGVQLSVGGMATAIHPNTPRSTAAFAVDDVPARRVHVLVLQHVPIDPRAPPKAFADVVLTHRDGRETRHTIMLREHVVNHTSPYSSPTTRIGLIGTSSFHVRVGGATSSQSGTFVFHVAFEIPVDAAPVRSLRFEAPDGPMEAPLFYAATLERDPYDVARR